MHLSPMSTRSDHQRLLGRLSVYIADPRLLSPIVQVLRRCAELGWAYRQGIALGCPLSPIIGAFYLSELDAQLECLGLFYVRYMDDILVLSPTRWKLRHAVRGVNQALGNLGLGKHPDKTFIGRLDHGFDFLGSHIHPKGLAPARKPLAQFVARVRRLYEQELGAVEAAARLGMVVRHWVAWVDGGLPTSYRRRMIAPSI